MATSNMTSLIDLAKTNQIAPVTQDFDESKGVASRVQSITSKASPLMQTARTRAAQNSASRGLLNSSIGAQAGEQAVIETLAAYNLAGVRKPGAPGIYVAKGQHAGAKIAALGLKIRASGCTYHGVSLNVAMDLQAFSWINPCGYPGLQTIDMRTLGVDPTLTEAQYALAQQLEKQLRA